MTKKETSSLQDVMAPNVCKPMSESGSTGDGAEGEEDTSRTVPGDISIPLLVTDRSHRRKMGQGRVEPSSPLIKRT